MIAFLTIILILGLRFSCLCNDMPLNKELIRNADLIVLGEIVAVDSVQKHDDELLFTVKVKQLYKGRQDKKGYCYFLSSSGSCGMVSLKNKQRIMKRECLLYLSKQKGSMWYNPCSDRARFKSPFYQAKEEQVQEFAKKFDEELEELKQLLKKE